MEPYGYEELADEARGYLDELAARDDLEVEIVDFSDLDEFGGTDTDFYDGVHMTRPNTVRVLEELHRRGLLAPR